MKICMIGEGAQAETHMQALQSIDGVEVVTLAGGVEESMGSFAEKWQIPHCSVSLEECLLRPDVEAVINTGPSQLHAEHTRLCIEQGKHVLLEIPMALSLEDCDDLVRLERESGLTCMVCHTRHFTTGLRALREMLIRGELHLHHIVVQTYFFRRENINRFGQRRTWIDDLLWHHACHAVDMTRWLLDDDDMRVWGQVGPDHQLLGIPMDLSIGMKSRSRGVIATIAHSFNNHGLIQTPMRFIGEEETYTFINGVLADHLGNEVAKGTAQVAVIRQNREFFEAVRDQRTPATSFARSLGSMRYLHEIEQSINATS